MRKFFLILISTINILYSYIYDDILLQAQIKLYPKIILLDQKFSENKKQHIIFTIVYDYSDFQKAKNIKRLIENKYKNGINGTKLFINIISFQNIDQTISTSALYLLKASPEDIKKVSKIGQKKQIIVFSYDLNDFSNETLISLYIKESPVLYYNQKVHKKYNINFLDTFYQIVRFKND